MLIWHKTIGQVELTVSSEEGFSNEIQEEAVTLFSLTN